MTVILGLDVSTSCVGVCVVDSDVEPDDKGSHILMLDRIEFKRCKTFWEKTFVVRDYLYYFQRQDLEMTSTHHLQPFRTIDRVVIEEPLMGFRAGMSSAQTITQLMRFNGIVSYIAFETLGCEPEYMSAAHARKVCGIKVQKTAIGGPQKEQVFKFFAENDLRHIVWPTKKNGKPVDWSRDATDSYCIARAASVKETTSKVRLR